MKHSLLFALIATMLPLSAATKVQMQSTDLTDNKTVARTLVLTPTQFSMNDPETFVVFQGGAQKSIRFLDKRRNEYFVMDEAAIQQLAGQMSGIMAQMQEALKNVPEEQRALMEKMMKGKMPQQAAPARVDTVYTRTGTDTVNGFSCTKYEGNRSGQKVAELCAAQPGELKMNPADFGVFLEVREFAAGLQDALANSPFGQAAGAGFSTFTDAGFEGFPVTETHFNNGKAASRDTIESVEQVTTTAADFEMPATAKAAQIPGIGGR